MQELNTKQKFLEILEIDNWKRFNEDSYIQNISHQTLI